MRTLIFYKFEESVFINQVIFMLENLKKKNPHLNLYHINDNRFNSFGKVLNFNHFKELSSYLNSKTEIPENANIYIAHDDLLAKSLTDMSVYHDVFGDMPLQYGYVNGQNTKLNALEYHKSSEINIALKPLVLLFGSANDIENRTYDSSKLIAFYIPENTAIEIYPRTLHFSPFKVLDLGFKCGVILPYGTNMEFVKPVHLDHDEDYLLFKTNKWLLAHPEHTKMINLGAFIGITGTNIEVKY